MPLPAAVPDAAWQLFREIGATLHTESLPATVPSDPDVPLRQLGSRGALPCWWTPARENSARRHANRLARSGHPGLILSGCESPQFALMVTVRPCCVYRVGAGSEVTLRLTRLSRMASTGSRLGDALAAVAALDLDAHGRETFRSIRLAIRRAETALAGSDDHLERQSWLLLQVTRLLFLRFVESEGWLNGSMTFLQDQIDHALSTQQNPGRTVLTPLFFGTLNRPTSRRAVRARQFGVIPFLNGGLFEPHPLERSRRWQLSSEHWRDLLDILINRTEVSLDSAANPEAVSPEMMGRILEGLMDPEERTKGGVFYTPPALVERLVRESFVCHLARRLDRAEHQLDEALDAPDLVLQAALQGVSVLDPAVGSGAFLVGAFNLMRKGAATDGRLARQLLTQNLHGIDRNPTAVRITELRLWLELLRTMRGTGIENLDPLPNLDGAIRAGDAVIDPLAGRRIPRALIATIESARHQVERGHGRSHHSAQRRLVAAEIAAIDAALDEELTRLRIEHADARDTLAAPQLFGTSPRESPRLHALAAEIAALESSRATLHREGRGAAFAIEAAWPKVIAGGGFDLVLGNPPWVRAAELPPPIRQRLAHRYRWWRSQGRGWSHQPDLSVAFLERSFGLLRPGGTMGLLVPGKVATTSYAATSRAALVRESTLHVVADLVNDPDAAFDATTYPLALIASRRRADLSHTVRRRLGAATPSLPQSAWEESPSWIGVDGKLTALIQRLASTHPRLDEDFSPSIGVKTGANDLFLDPPPALAEWTRPAIRGRDLHTDGLTIRHSILWPLDATGRTLRTLPEPVHDFLKGAENRLRRRADNIRGPWWQLFRVGPAASRWRVIWSDIARELHAIALEDPAPVPLNSCYVIPCSSPTRMRCLARWLSVTWIGAIARLLAERAAGGHHRFGARVVGALPSPVALWDDPCFTNDCSPSADERDARAAQLLRLNRRECASLLAIATDRC